MAKCILILATPENLNRRGNAPDYTQEIHYGFRCEVGPDGELIADIPEGPLLEAELASGRARLVN